MNQMFTIGKRRLLLALAALLMTGAADHGTEPSDHDEQVASLRALQEIDQRVLSVGHRLAVASLDLCPDAAWLSGLRIHDLSQYSGRQKPVARAVFAFHGTPAILAVALGSAADRAGVKPNDSLVAIAGKSEPRDETLDGSYARVQQTLVRLDAASVGGTLALTLERAGVRRDVSIAAQRGCATRFQTRDSDKVNAQADGQYVEVTTGMLDFVANDDELAAVIAHELAHNVLRHRAVLDAAGVRRGLLGSFGTNARKIRATEIEADRLGVYIVERAGYPTSAIVSFWTRYRRAHGQGIFRTATHPGEQERIGVVEAEIARIASARGAGAVPQPNIAAATR